MNKLMLNITINFCHETKTAEQMAEELKQLGLVEVIQASIESNPEAITVGAFTEEAMNSLYNLYKDTNINLWADNFGEV